MHRTRLVAGACLAAAVSAGAGDLAPLRGYGPEGSRIERGWEAKLRALPSPDKLRESMRRLSAWPHHVGSPYDEQNADWILARFREWGWEAEIETFQVLFPTPLERRVELLAPTRFVAKLEEPAVAVDPTSGQKAEQLPTYNAYSADGDVTAPLVYVNYGVPEDYETLERLGISVEGAIVIARYGHSWRGIKPKVAAEHGAVGCLLYSDPRDDGYFAGDVFPRGAWRPEHGVQRGSVQDGPLYSGDPLTPGVGATPGARRLPREQAATLTKIPVLPLSHADARPLLEALGGPVAPEAWRGALPLSYHIGPGPARVHLKVRSSWDIRPIHDVIARIPGATDPDAWVLRGNHHDAWVNGAEDPVSGLSALLEEARALGELLKQGWRPRRTIVYCAWDGEEPGLLGSTEWAEAHEEELRRHAVVYLNTDSTGRGFLGMEGSHALEPFLNDVAREIEDPETGLSAWKREKLRRIGEAKTPAERAELRDRRDLRVGPLGSGSDYAAFLDHLGIASANLGFGGEGGGGVYHSIYDDFYWYTHFSDTDFVYGRALAQAVGTAVMRLADAEWLPLDFASLADTVGRYVAELKELLAKQRAEVEERNRQIEEGVFAAVADPRLTSVPPASEAVPPHLNFAPLENAAAALERSAARYAAALAGWREAAPSAEALRALNERLRQAERALTSPEGLPGRPWYRHLLYAPGFYTGYAAKTVPSVREALERKRWAEAEAEIGRVAKALEAESALIDAAAGTLAGKDGPGRP